MAIKSGRVGVRPDQVDEYGRVVATDYLVDQLKEVLPSGELVPLHVNLNGTYNPLSGTGFGPVTVTVPLDVDAIASGRPRGPMTLTVEEVVPYAFYHKDITRLTCSNATSIGERAFAYCTQLTHFTTSLVTSLGDGVFSFCNRLVSAAISALQTMGNECFMQCSDLESVTFTHVTSIGTSAFEGCSKLSAVNMPMLNSIGANAFKDCSLLSSFSNSNVTILNSNTFRNCTGLTSVDLPNVTSIGGNCFQGCSNSDFTSAIFPNVTSISGQAFNNCKAKLVFPSLIKTSTNCFSTWKGKEIDFGVNFNQIEGFTFNGMSANDPFDTLILRNSTAVVTANNNSGIGNAQFSANKSGGTVYIPRVLYDHLGDGTSLDYLTSTQWTNMLNANSNNTFAPIEGSYYETHYADGTLINS